jgi:hypothetical protein
VTPPLLLDGFTSPVTLGATAGIWTAVRVPTLDEVRSRRREPQPCVCTDGSCRRCFLDDDAAYERSLDV